MKLKTLEQFGQKDPCECGGNCGCGGKPVNEKFSFSEDQVKDVAELIAKAIAKVDKSKTAVHDMEYDAGRGAGFDISMDGMNYEGGSYVVRPNGEVYNAAIGNSFPNAVYAKIGDTDIKKVMKNIKKFESEITEAKKYKFKDLAKAWQHVYGEDMEDEYQGFFQEVTGKYKDKVTKKDIAEIWMNTYGEDITTDYDGFYNDLKENLEQVAKLEALDNLVEANTDGTISDDEDGRMDIAEQEFYDKALTLAQELKDEAYEIGGNFRGPGYEHKLMMQVKDAFKKAKLKLR